MTALNGARHHARAHMLFACRAELSCIDTLTHSVRSSHSVVLTMAIANYVMLGVAAAY